MSHKSNAVNETLMLPLGPEFEKRLAELAGEDEEFVIAMMDMDNILRTNNEFGHETGDRVLIESGKYFMESAAGAELYRYGGDEFAMLFRGLEKEEVFLAMERVRAGYGVKLPDGSAQTITIGIAAFPEDASSALELIRKAEGAMFRGKQAGRNRVCLSREDKMVTKTAHYTVEQLNRLTKVSKREGIGEAILLREALDALLKKYDV